MTTIFSDPRGLQMDLFLQKYQNQIKDKHILYVVSTNLEEDEQISRSTRGVLGGVNLKIGKATANAYARLKASSIGSSVFLISFARRSLERMSVSVAVGGGGGEDFSSSRCCRLVSYKLSPYANLKSSECEEYGSVALVLSSSSSSSLADDGATKRSVSVLMFFAARSPFAPYKPLLRLCFFSRSHSSAA